MLPKFWIGFSFGFGTGVFAREIMPAVKTAARPIARSAVRTSTRFLYRSQEALHRFAEFIEDTAAETKSEMKEEVRSGLKTDLRRKGGTRAAAPGTVELEKEESPHAATS